MRPDTPEDKARRFAAITRFLICRGKTPAEIEERYTEMVAVWDEILMEKFFVTDRVVTLCRQAMTKSCRMDLGDLIEKGCSPDL